MGMNEMNEKEAKGEEENDNNMQEYLIILKRIEKREGVLWRHYRAIVSVAYSAPAVEPCRRRQSRWRAVIHDCRCTLFAVANMQICEYAKESNPQGIGIWN